MPQPPAAKLRLKHIARGTCAGSAVPLMARVILIDTGMAERSLPMFPLVDAGIYALAVNGAKAKLNETQLERLEVVNTSLAASFGEVYGAEVQRVVSPFDLATMTLTYFSKATAAIKAEVARLCAENNAEYAICPTGRVITASIGMLGLNGSSYATFELAILDKSGELVALGNAYSPTVVSGAADALNFGTLFDGVINSLNLLIPLLGQR